MAEPSEPTSSSPETTAYVVARLVYWGRVAPKGMALVEFLSQPVKRLALDALRRAFAEADIPYHEVTLEPERPAAEHIQRLREALTEIPDGVVSILGWERARPADVSVADWLPPFQFVRDVLARFPLRQIWWMPRELARTLAITVPSLDRFFLVQMRLSETPPLEEENRRLLPLSNAPALSAEEAEASSALYVARFRRALERNEPLMTVLSLATQAYSPLLQAGRVMEAASLYASLSAEMRAKGYQADAYLTGQDAPVRLDKSDIETFYQLATLYRDTGDYAQAERILEQVLAWQRVHLEDGHPDIATTLNNLAALYDSQGRHEEAETLYKQALEIRQQVLPEGHPDIAQSLNNLAELYRSQGRYEEAEPLYRRAVDIFIAALGMQHPNTTSGIQNFLICLMEMGREAEVEEIAPGFAEWYRQAKAKSS